MRLQDRKHKVADLKDRAHRILDQAESDGRQLSGTEAKIVDGLIREARAIYLSYATPTERREHQRKWTKLEG